MLLQQQNIGQATSARHSRGCFVSFQLTAFHCNQLSLWLTKCYWITHDNTNKHNINQLGTPQHLLLLLRSGLNWIVLFGSLVRRGSPMCRVYIAEPVFLIPIPVHGWPLSGQFWLPTGQLLATTTEIPPPHQVISDQRTTTGPTPGLPRYPHFLPTNTRPQIVMLYPDITGNVL